MDRNKGEAGNGNRKWMMLGALGLTLLTKYKTLIPLLSKVAVPVFSMLASIVAYAWMTRSIGVAIGLVAMIFVHELGHVLAAKRRGLPASAPVFIPFLGALILLKQHPRDAVTEAYVAIGGPLLGSLGALAVYLGGVWMDSMVWIVVAYFGFFINLLNLLPIHPLDGGRIVTAVTRWLWLVGLVGGLAVIIYLQSILFFIIWAMFAFELYTKYIAKQSKKSRRIPFQIQIPIEYLRLHGLFVPGEQHQRELEFVTYSSLDSAVQTIEVYWSSLGIRDKVQLQHQYLISSVHVTGIKHVHDEGGALTKVVAACEIKGEPYVNDRYYEVPDRTRWFFGCAYIGLAIFLIVMMLSVHAMNIPGVG